MAKPDRLSQYAVEDEIIWSDKKRYLGMPISFTQYSFDANRFYRKTGVLTIIKDEILLYRILDVSIKRTFWQRIFGVGSILLSTADHTLPHLEIKNVKDSERVCKALSNIVEKERDEKRVLGKEMFGAASINDGVDHDCDHFDHSDSSPL